MDNNKKRVELIFEGKRYIRRDEQWTDSSYIIVSETMQRKLNDAYARTIDLSELCYDELVSEADSFKESSSYLLAISYYEAAIRKATANDIKYILPRVTSCYRRSKQPQKAIKVFSEVKNQYGAGFFSPALLTSAAAAFCDMGEYEKAKKCCDRAFAMSGGRASGELHAVYSRIRKESDL